MNGSQIADETFSHIQHVIGEGNYLILVDSENTIIFYDCQKYYFFISLTLRAEIINQHKSTLSIKQISVINADQFSVLVIDETQNLNRIVYNRVFSDLNDKIEEEPAVDSNTTINP
jgi:hypothetical protein